MNTELFELACQAAILVPPKSSVGTLSEHRLHSAINELNEKYRQVLYLVYFEEMSAEESSKVMKLTRKQTENLIFRARCALKAILEKDGYDYENL